MAATALRTKNRKTLRAALLVLLSLVPCALLAFFFLGPYEQGFSYKKVYGNDGAIGLGPGWEAVLPVARAPSSDTQLDLTIYCKEGPCGRLGVKTRQGGAWQAPDHGDASAAYYRLSGPGGLAKGLLIENRSDRKVLIGEYRLKDYVANNSNLPSFMVSLHPRSREYGPAVMAALFLLMALLQAASLWVAARRFAGWRRAVAMLLVIGPPWLAAFAAWLLAGQRLHLTLAPDTLLILACAGGLALSAVSWGPGLAVRLGGAVRQSMLAPIPANSQRLLDQKIAPLIYAALGLYLAYVSVFSLIPGHKAPEWTVEPYTWLAFLAVLAGLLLAWRVGLRGLVAFLSERLPVWVIIAFGFLLRLAWVCFSQVKQPSDWRQFCQMALDIFHGAYIINPDKPTGPSLIAAGVYHLVGGPWVTAALIPVALASSLEIALVYAIAHRYFGAKAARMASLLLALWPAHILMANLMGSDAYFSFFVLLALWLWSLFRQSPWDLLLAALAGLSLGAAHWMRPTTPFFVLALLVLTALWWWRRPFKLALLTAGLFLGLALLIAPIMMINQEVLGTPSAVPAQLGNWSLLEGANQKSHGWYSMVDLRLVAQEADARQWPEDMPRALRLEAVARELAWQRICADPWGYAQLCVFQKPLSLWGRVNHQRHSLATSILGYWDRGIETFANYWHKVMLALAVAALLWGGWRRTLPTGVFFAMTLAALIASTAHTILEVQPRYHFMFIPWLAVLVGSWLAVMAGRGQTRAGPPGNQP